MTRSHFWFVWSLGIILTITLFSSAHAGILPSEVLVVYNRQHQYSENVARYYASVRGIPERNLCGIDTVTDEAITGSLGATYCSGLIDQIEQYLLDNFNPYPSDPDYFKTHPSIDPIKAITICYGVPANFGII